MRVWRAPSRYSMKHEVGLHPCSHDSRRKPGLLDGLARTHAILPIWRLHVYGVRLVAILSSEWLRR